MSTGPRLALGTVQFGLAYGVAGRKAPVPADEACAILARAWDHGIRRLDTAPGYGDIESRIAALSGDLPFEIVSKIPATPRGSEEVARDHVRTSVARSRARLGERLAGLLFHDADDLLAPLAAATWDEARAAGVPLGPSCYDPATFETLAARFPLGMAQLPGNALDQRVRRLAPGRAEITLRSVFLQGLLLMPVEEAARQVPRAAAALRRWRDYCAGLALCPLEAALSLAKGLPSIAYCVVGVDSHAQLDEIAAAWERARPRTADSLNIADPDIIDPRRWPKTA